MECLTPYQAFQEIANPSNVIVCRPGSNFPAAVRACPHRYKSFQVPCYKCINCRRTRALEIAVRARCEFAIAKTAAFVTLTVSDEHMQEVFPGMKLTHRAFQLFMKRLRKAGVVCRYLMCGEYGSKTHRPHYHVILFGWMPDDMYFDDDGCRHDSKILEECWPFGHVRCDEVNDNRIFYVSGYTLKESAPGYESYCKWSRRPGLGFEFLRRFWPDIYKRNVSWQRLDDGSIRKLNGIVSRYFAGRKFVTTSIRYFNQKLELFSPETFGKLSSGKAEYGALSRFKPFNLLMAERDSVKREARFLEYVLKKKVRDVEDERYFDQLV